MKTFISQHVEDAFREDWRPVVDTFERLRSDRGADTCEHIAEGIGKKTLISPPYTSWIS